MNNNEFEKRDDGYWYCTACGALLGKEDSDPLFHVCGGEENDG